MSRVGAVDDRAERELRGEAVAWVQHLDSGRVTPADVKALKQWRSRSPDHEAAFADARRMWKEFAPAARSLRERGQLSPALAARPVSHSTLSRRAAIGGALATVSAAAAYAMVSPPLDLWPSIAELAADYRTVTGEQRQLELPSDVSMHLNSQTSVALRGNDGARIELVSGEASFVSKSQQERPLIVLAANGVMTTSRAHFDVRRAGQSVCVTCVGGNVNVTLESQATTLGSGQQVRYDDRGLGPVASIDIELVTAWQQGVLIFRSAPLAEVVEEINRYRSGRVILMDRELARKPISGRFRIDHMDDILVRLNQAFGITSRTLPGGIVLLT
ncbi:FecR domain-containing protein [Bradyrhizobium sp. 31Argb]|uniref:FecR family protein n=1 Tax=Bradyrhizobium sp. 31Argb TaxID=3141247 RepID=UPI003747B5DB